MIKPLKFQRIFSIN